MALRLTFVPETERAGGWVGISGDDAADVLDQWNELENTPWPAYGPADFRERLVEFTGASVEMPAADDEILPAVVAAEPDALRLEAGARTPQQMVADAAAKVIGPGSRQALR